MDKLKKFYIDGDWVDPIANQLFPVVNPATEKKIGEVAMGGSADVDRAVDAAQIAFRTFSVTSKAERL